MSTSIDSIFEEPPPTHLNVKVGIEVSPGRFEAYARPGRWARGFGQTIGEALTQVTAQIRNEIPSAWSLALHFGR